ncbi:MAG: ABC transporter permease [Asgard group archaeon]|nr:ABC transporter permease [Asgard group archaeon]
MKKGNAVVSNSRRYITQNLFILTRTFYRLMTDSDPLQEKTNKAVLWSMLLFLPILMILVPILDIFLIFFLPGLHIFKPLFKAGWKYGLISSIGVTLAVAIITQYVFFIYSYQYQAFGLYLSEEPRSYIQMELDYSYIIPSPSQYFSIDGFANDALFFAGKEIEDLDQRILDTELYFKRATFTQTYDPVENENTLPNMPLIGTEGGLRSHLSLQISNGTIPTEDFEALALVTREFYNHSSIRVNSTIPLYVPIALDKRASLQSPAAQTELNITGIVIIDEVRDYTFGNSGLSIPLDVLFELEGGAAVVSWWKEAASVLHDIAVTGGLATLYEDLFYDVRLINAFNIQSEINILKLIIEELKQSYVTFGITELRVNSYLVNLMENFRDEYNLYQTFMFAFLSPIIVLTIILTVYAANLVRKKRDRQLTILTERGTRRREIGSYLALEALITGTISLFFGTFLGVPIAALLTKSSGFLSFGNTTIPLKLELSSVIIALLGSVGAIILIQLFNTITLLKKRDIEDYGRIEKSLPIYYKYFVDLILIAFGIVTWFIFKMPALSNYQDQSAKFIGIPSIVLMLFGLILFVQRLLPLFARGLARITSKLKMDIPSLSVREISRYQKSFARSSVIICLSFSLVISTIVVPSTYQDFNTDGAYYDLGADIVIRSFPIENENLKQNIRNLTEVESITVVRFINLHDEGDTTVTYSVLAINRTSFVDTAYFRSDFSDVELKDMLELLDTPLSVLVQQDELNILDDQVGEEKSITYTAYSEEFRLIPPITDPTMDLNLTISLVEKYKYWPNLVSSISISNALGSFYHFVADFSFLEHIYVSPLDVIDYLYIKVAEGYDIETTAERIGTIVTTGLIYNVEDEIYVKPDSPRSSILYSAINSTLIMSFAINVIILALFASIQLIDKSKEIATMKAIGISGGQLIKYYLSVYIALLAFTTILGIIIGYIASAMLMGVLTFTRNIPPYFLTIPVRQILTVIGLLLGAAILGATIPTITSTRQEIGTELRQSA